MGTIELESMEFYAYHGCFKEEQLVGNRFMVDLSMQADCSKAANSDNLKDAVNYQVAYQLVKSEIEVTSHLLEHVANRILIKLLKTLPQIQWAKVKVSKMNPPLGGKTNCVSVTLAMSASDIEALGK